MGKRERKKHQTRERLADVALELFAQHGYDATTVEMIAEGAGVSGRTFFRYFDTKDQVLAEPGARLMVAVAQRLGHVPPTERGVRAVVETMGELLKDDGFMRPTEIQAWSTRAGSELQEAVAGWRHRWADELAELLADGDGREHPTFEERAICSASVAVMGSVFDEWFRRGGAIDPRTLVRQASAAVCDGPVPPRT